MKKKLFVSIWFFMFLAITWGVYKVSLLKTEYAVDQFYPKNHPLLFSHQEVQRQFRLNEKSPHLFILEFNHNEDWINPRQISHLQNLTQLIQDQDNVAQVLSLTQIEGASTSNDEMVIGNFFDRIPSQSWKEKIVSNALLYPSLISKDFKSTLVAVEFKGTSKSSLEKFENDIIKLITETIPSVKIRSAGVPFMQTKLSSIIESELSKCLLYISLAFCILFYLLFSHWSSIICAFLTLLTSNILALAIMSEFNIPMNAVLVTVPVIVSVSMMSLLIHSLHLWAKQKVEGMTLEKKLDLAVLTFKDIWLPNFLGSITTAIGFLAITPSSIPLISQYGFTVASLLTFLTIVGQALILIQLPLITPKMRPWFDQPANWALFGMKHSRKIIILTCLMTFSGLVVLTNLNFSQRLFDDLPSGDNVRQNSDWIDQNLGGIVNYDIKLQHPSEGFWKTPHSIKRLDQLSKELRKNNSLGTIVTISDFFQGDIPSQQDQISELFFLFSMAAKNPLLSFMTEDGKNLRIALRFSDLPSIEIEKAKKNIQDTTLKYFPEISITEAGMASYSHAINQEVSEQLIFSFWQPLLLIGLFLILIFRSIRWAVLSCIPNFIPPIVLASAIAILQIPVKPGIALIFSIAIGFAFNNTLYLLSRLHKLSRSQDEQPLHQAFLQEANPCLFETIIMFVGFSIFLSSEFNMNQTFGGFMLISILAGFFGDLFFLPALLKEFPKLYALKLAPIPLRRIQTKIASIVVIFFWCATASASPEAKEILKKSQSLLDASDDQASVEMKIIEQNGEEKSRLLSLKTLRKDGFSVLARIESPADIKNMSFLGLVDNEGDEKQWIYMPSSGKVRRLVTGKTKAGLLGSEISPEDLNSEAIKSSSVKLLKTDQQYHWIELIPTVGTSEYSKVVTKISKEDLLPKFTAYYIKEKLKKTVAFKEYKKIGKIFRAHVLKVQNHLNGRSTEIKLSNVKINSGLDEGQFSQSSLKDW